MRLSPSTIVQGEPVWIDEKITNRSPHTVTVEHPNGCLGTQPIAVISDAQQTNGEHTSCDGSVECLGKTPTPLRPGESLSYRFVLSGKFRITHPGRYGTVLKDAVRYWDGDVREPSRGREQPVRLNVTLTVLPTGPQQLLTVERSLAAIVAPSGAKPRTNAQWAKTEETKFQIAEGLAAYPAVGMEPVFGDWLHDESLYDIALEALYHLNTPLARLMLSGVAVSLTESTDVIVNPGAEKAEQLTVASRRQRAVTYLANMGDRSYLPLLERLAKDNDSSIVDSAIRGVGLLGREDAIPFLDSLALNDKNANLRQVAVEALGNTATLRAVPILIGYFGMKDLDPSGALYTLTHHRMTEGSAAEAKRNWRAWWISNGRTAKAYGPYDCEH